MDFIGIIPARYASTRFPGKPLVEIEGKTMIRRVVEQVSKSLDHVFVATDDERIKREVEKNGHKVIMTSTEHKSGTDRCAEAAKKIISENIANYPFSENHKQIVIMNIQGDEPFISPSQIGKLKNCFENETTEIATLVKKISNTEELFSPDIPKVVFTKNKEALYFSRSVIPYFRASNKDHWLSEYTYYKHIGIYAYRYDILQIITNLDSSLLETAEALEQNRWLENGYKIIVDETDRESVAIDIPDDLLKVKKLGLT